MSASLNAGGQHVQSNDDFTTYTITTAAPSLGTTYYSGITFSGSSVATGSWTYNISTQQWEQAPEVVQWNGHTYLSPSPKLKMMCDAVRLI